MRLLTADEVRELIRQRFHESAQEAVCECGAPEARLCECSDEAQEVDSNETLMVRR